MDEHDHNEEVTTTEINLEPMPAVGHDDHNHSGLDGLWEVMFGFEHVVAEIFWNTVWLAAAFAIGRMITFRKMHKYIDDKHGVTHNKGDY
jgi:hypothetical protein